MTIRDVIERHGYLAYRGDPNPAGEAWEEAGFGGPRRKRSTEKATVLGAKQVFRDYAEGEMRGDVIARVDELPGRPLLVPFMRGPVWCARRRSGR